MFVWRKRAGARWLAANEGELRELADQRLAVIFKPANNTSILEVADGKHRSLESLRRKFGGAIEKLPRDWQTQERKAKPIKIGQRLIIARSQIVGRALRLPTLVIPAGTAFGTGEHATTAMSLRLLERTMRRLRGSHAPRLLVSALRRNNLFGKSDRDILWNISPERSAGHRAQHARRMRSSERKNFSVLDLGTGSGILALAAARLGAQRVIALDSDLLAISTAKENARRNKIHNVEFHLADVRQWKFPRRIDIVTANLFSELLIEILPKLTAARCLIVSGILRSQESGVARALRRNNFSVWETRRRGKWVAILCQNRI